MRLPNFMHTIESSMYVSDILELLNSAQSYCAFIKNKHSTYCYANNNYIQLMGLQNLQQLMRADDYDLSKNKKNADIYREHDNYILEEGKTLEVREVVYPNYNQHIIKTMKGKLYPLHVESDSANYILGLVVSETKLLSLDFEAIFTLTPNELDSLLIKCSYTVRLRETSLKLSRMEIQTIIQLLRGANAGEIATALKIKQRTVESYIVNIKNKLAVNNRHELISLVLSEKVLQQIVI